MFPDVEKSNSGGRFNLSIFQIVIHFLLANCHMKNVQLSYLLSQCCLLLTQRFTIYRNQLVLASIRITTSNSKY